MSAFTRRLPSAGLDRFSGLYLWGLFVVVFAIWVPDLFFTAQTAHSIASQQAVVGILAIALLVPLAAGAYDLSIGANINLCCVLAAVLQTKHDQSIGSAIVITVGVGLLVGLVNGFVVVKLGISSFIGTLATGSIILALQQIVTGGSQPTPPVDTAWLDLTQATVGGFQVVFVYLLVVAAVVWWALTYTPAGRNIYAIGSNPEAARLAGVRVDTWTWLSLVFCGGLAGFAGVLYSSLSGPSLTFGPSLLLPSFAAVFLGSTQLVPGRFNVWGTLLAIYALATGVQGLQFVLSVQWLNNFFYGFTLLLAVGFAVWRQRVAVNRRLSEQSEHPPGAPPEPQPQSSEHMPQTRSTEPSNQPTQEKV